MDTIAAPMLSLSVLKSAWKETQKRDVQDGEVAPAILRFAEAADEHLERLAEDLENSEYRPVGLTEVPIRTSTRERILHIPAVRDRVVARAVLALVTARLDPLLGASAFGYRPGLGVSDAVQAIVEAREAGMTFVLRTDVDECFPSIPVETVLRRFRAVIGEGQVADVVDALARRTVCNGRKRGRAPGGLPQGCPLSPLLTNLLLVDVDDALNEAGFMVVRYADDIAVLGESRDDMEEAVRIAAAALKEHRMTLGEDKTEIMTFEEGFAFLGEDFGPKYPPFLPLQHVPDPEDRVLYVGVQGSRVRISQGRVLVEDGTDKELLDVPSGQVMRVVTFGAVGISAGFRSWAMDRGVDVVLASRRGTLLGTMVGSRGEVYSARLQAQVHLQDSERQVELARVIVAAKIAKQMTLLRRFGKKASAETVSTAVTRMSALMAMLEDAGTVDEVMGLEGAAANEYFPAYGSLFPVGLNFRVRSRRPPMDVTNSALSFLYTVLSGECVSAIRAAGMEPSLGVLHRPQEKRPSLALDLVEEFRPLVVDQVVLSAARHKRLLPEHARTDTGRGGVLLTKRGRESILEAYEERMLQVVRGALPDFSGSLRRHVFRQAQRLGGAIADHEREFTGLSWRR